MRNEQFRETTDDTSINKETRTDMEWDEEKEDGRRSPRVGCDPHGGRFDSSKCCTRNITENKNRFFGFLWPTRFRLSWWVIGGAGRGHDPRTSRRTRRRWPVKESRGPDLCAAGCRGGRRPRGGSWIPVRCRTCRGPSSSSVRRTTGRGRPAFPTGRCPRLEEPTGRKVKTKSPQKNETKQTKVLRPMNRWV